MTFLVVYLSIILKNKWGVATGQVARFRLDVSPPVLEPATRRTSTTLLRTRRTITACGASRFRFVIYFSRRPEERLLPPAEPAERGRPPGAMARRLMRFIANETAHYIVVALVCIVRGCLARGPAPALRLARTARLAISVSVSLALSLLTRCARTSQPTLPTTTITPFGCIRRAVRVCVQRDAAACNKVRSQP